MISGWPNYPEFRFCDNDASQYWSCWKLDFVIASMWCDSLVLLGLTFQPNCKFSEHVRLKLTKANKCLHILRTLRKELFSQKEIDHLFKTLVLPILTYGLAVYGASDSDLNVIQRFLDRCHKRHLTSQTVSIFNLLEQQDKSAFKRAINKHMPGAIIPKDKELEYNLRRRRCHLPQIKTERYKKTFVNRLICSIILSYVTIVFYRVSFNTFSL